MRFLLFLSILMGGLFSSVISDTKPISAPMAGYGLMDLTWNIVPNVVGAEAVNITGTMQDVINYLNTTYENYPFPVLPAFNQTPVNTTTFNNSVDDVSANIDYCYNWPSAGIGYIWTGVHYLLSIQGDGMNGPGPGNCGQVSCSFDSSIWWCNDNNVPYAITFKDVGFAAWHIIDSCYDSNADFGVVSGQIMFPGNWNVIVRKSSC